MKYYIEIPEVYKALVKVELPEGTMRDKVIEAAQKIFEKMGSNDLEYSHTLEQEEWTVCDGEGNHLVG